MSSSNKVGTNFPRIIVKHESIEGDFSERSPVVKIEVIPHSVNGETKVPSHHTNGESAFEKASLLTDRVVKIKKEEDDSEITPVLVSKIKKEEDDSEITRVLVSSYRYSGECEDQKYLQEVKLETGCENIEQESHSNNFGTRCNSGIFLTLTDNERLLNETKENTFEKRSQQKRKNEENARDQIQGKINYDSKVIKLKNVSVKLTDLFPSYLRKLGKAHLSTGECSCIYCRGEYRYSRDSQHLSENLRNEKQPLLAKKNSRKFTNSSECQQRLRVKMQEVQSSIGPFQRHCKLLNDDKPFKCKQCPAKFLQKSILTDHVQLVHIEQRRFTCSRCPASFKTKFALTSHARTHSGKKLFKCKLCLSKFAQSTGLYKHKINIHSQIRLFECKLCPATFKWRDSLNAHARRHSDERLFKCTHCPASFKTKCGLNGHVKLHIGEKRFTCEHCSVKCLTKSGIRKHLMVHSGEKPFKCKLCPSAFSRRSSLRIHVQCVHSDERPFKCTQCPAKFKLKAGLKDHARLHTGEKSFRCNYCPAKFAHKCSLKTHLRMHSGEKPFECRLCLSRFRQSSSLDTHMKCIHSDVKAFECKFCLAKFKLKYSLNVHLRRHSGERPFSCKHCPAKRITSSALNVHMRIHNSGDPFSCAHCSAKFKLKHTLVVHLKRVH